MTLTGQTFIERITTALLCLSLVVWSMLPSLSHVPRIAETLNEHAQMVADHGHSHGFAEDLLWALHGHNGSDAAPQLLAILDCYQRLVLAGAASHGTVAWCHPVANALEARAVVTEAVKLRAQAGRAAAWGEPDLAKRLRHRADLLDARLVDPLWRAFAARALQVAA